ncbi:M10 family metallopeptidase C-terminal domain-containing protein [Arsenophonus sp. PmNCSU2021_1]|uniref:M10 family metallopeptidase C-terminal domain-containing protein n=1 Tax=Arsenophonus sp. PmNCSU2021_1 TaxID=3118989 RepID=UPI002FF24905
MDNIFNKKSNSNDEIDKFLNSNMRGSGLIKNGKKSFSVDTAAEYLKADNHTAWESQHKSTQPLVINYSFPNFGGDKTFTPLQKKQAEESLQSWEDVANIKFNKVDSVDESDITFSNQYSGRSYDAITNYRYRDNYTHSDILVNLNGDSHNPAIGNYPRQAIVHELGHALGLRHPGDYNSYYSYDSQAEYAEGSKQYTVMSYFDASETGANHGGLYSAAPLLDDIASAQKTHGANTKTRIDDSIYGFNSNTNRKFYTITEKEQKNIFCIWDAGGDDTLDLSGYDDDQRINLNENSFSDVGGLTSNISIAKGTVIENVISGSGNDLIVGNKEDNIIKGGRGNDVIYGGEGQDQLWVRHNHNKIIANKNTQDIKKVYEEINSNSILDFEDIDSPEKKQLNQSSLQKISGKNIKNQVINLEGKYEKNEAENSKLEYENRTKEYNAAMNEYVANNIMTVEDKSSNEQFIKGMKLTYFLDEKLENVSEKQKIIKESIEKYAKVTDITFELVDNPSKAKIIFGSYNYNTDNEKRDGQHFINIRDDNSTSIMHQLGHVMGLNDLVVPSNRTDVYKYTIMSPLSSKYEQELQDADLLALKTLYDSNISKQDLNVEEQVKKVTEENDYNLEYDNSVKKYNAAMNEYVANNITTTSYKMGEDIFVRGMKLTYFLDEKLENVSEKQKIIKESIEKYAKVTDITFELVDNPSKAKIIFGSYNYNTDNEKRDGQHFINIRDDNSTSITHQLGHVMGLNDLVVPSNRTDVHKYTIMSPLSSKYEQELQDADLLALQSLYGSKIHKPDKEEQSRVVIVEEKKDIFSHENTIEVDPFDLEFSEYIAEKITKEMSQINNKPVKLKYLIDEKIGSISEKQEKIIKEAIKECRQVVNVTLELVNNSSEAKIVFVSDDHYIEHEYHDGKYFLNINDNGLKKIMHQFGHILQLADLKMSHEINDIHKYTIMSPSSSEHPQKLQIADGIALQKLYGSKNEQNINVEEQFKVFDSIEEPKINITSVEQDLSNDLLEIYGPNNNSMETNHCIQNNPWMQNITCINPCVPIRPCIPTNVTNPIYPDTSNDLEKPIYPDTSDDLEKPIYPRNSTPSEESNTFVFKSIKDSEYGKADKIMDFKTGFDKIDISLINQELSNEKIHFVDVFRHNSGEAILKYDEKNNISDFLLKKDIDDTPDFELQIAGQVSQSDFLSA